MYVCVCVCVCIIVVRQYPLYPDFEQWRDKCLDDGFLFTFFLKYGKRNIMLVIYSLEKNLMKSSGLFSVLEYCFQCILRSSPQLDQITNQREAYSASFPLQTRNLPLGWPGT